MEERSFELSFGNLNIIFTFPGCWANGGVGMQPLREEQLSKHSSPLAVAAAGAGNAAPNSYALCIQMVA